MTFYRGRGLRNLGYGKLIIDSNLNNKYKWNQGDLHVNKDYGKYKKLSQSYNFGNLGIQKRLNSISSRESGMQNMNQSYINPTRESMKVDNGPNLDEKYAKYLNSPAKTKANGSDLKQIERQVRRQAIRNGHNSFKISLRDSAGKTNGSSKSSFRNVLAQPVDDMNYNPYLKKHMFVD